MKKREKKLGVGSALLDLLGIDMHDLRALF